MFRAENNEVFRPCLAEDVIPATSANDSSNPCTNRLRDFEEADDLDALARRASPDTQSCIMAYDFPPEILLHIFSYVSLHQLANHPVAFASRRWLFHWKVLEIRPRS